MTNKRIGAVLAVLLLTTVSILQAQLPVPFCVDEIKLKKGKGPWAPYSKLRYMEDYSWLSEYSSDNAPYRDSWDKLKYIPMGEEGSFLSFGGRARLRYEGYENMSFNPTSDDSAYYLTRFLLHADLHVNRKFRLFTEVRNASVFDRDLPGGKADSLADEFDFMNLFVDIYPYDTGEESVLIRLGRFEQTYGKGRMIGCREWSQTRNPIQGAKVRYLGKDFWVDAFAAYSLISEKYEWAEINEDEITYGIYSHFGSDNPNLKHWELYVLGKNKKVGGIDAGRISYGSRVEGKFGKSGWMYDIEGAYQTGTQDLSVSAYFIEAEIKHSWQDLELKPTVVFNFSWASGDEDPNDGEVNTFEGVAPYGHFYFGFVDAIGRQNIVSPAVQLVLQPSRKLTLRGDFHMFWLDEPSDGLYSPCNCSKAIRRGFEGASAYVGSEVDLFFKYVFNQRWNVIGGYSHLFAGDFIAETGPDEDIDRVYAQVMFSF